MPSYSSYPGDSGGPPDFESVVETYYASLFRFAMSLTRAEADACDLVQDTFVIWAEKGQQLRDHSKIKGWLFTTLHRRFLERERKMARFPHVELSEVESELTGAADPATEALDASFVLQLLGQLDPGYRAAVALFYLEDYSHAEIASILDIPIGTVKSRLSRGLAHLKHRLEVKKEINRKDPK